MRKFFYFAPLFATLAITPANSAEPLSTDFINSKGETIGKATLKEIHNGTLISLDIKLPEGAHAIHIHETSKCDAPDFKTAGNHFNPTKKKHGVASKEGFHAGDLPNLYVEPSGHIKTEIFSYSLNLEGKHSIHNAAIIIHEKADDYNSDPSGNAGARIACAAIK